MNASLIPGCVRGGRASALPPRFSFLETVAQSPGLPYTGIMRRRSITAFLASLLALSLPLAAEKEMTALQIEVKNADGKPIDRASVLVRFVEGRSKVKFGKKVVTRWELRTNQLGFAKIPPIPQGKILVQVIAKGYQTYGKTHDVEEEEKTIEVKLNPPQSQYSAHQDPK
jgi:hypothetical protein